jgi:hypothetical protein
MTLIFDLSEGDLQPVYRSPAPDRPPSAFAPAARGPAAPAPQPALAQARESGCGHLPAANPLSRCRR